MVVEPLHTQIYIMIFLQTSPDEWATGIGTLIALLIIGSIIGGAADARNNRPPGANNFCERCIADRQWYFSLGLGRRIAYSFWWAGRWVACRIRGCF